MNILVIGGGGREHALAWKIKESPQCEKLYIAPGNAGTAEVGENVAIGVMEIDKQVAFAKEKQIDLVVVTPDDPLAAGAVDRFNAEGIRTFGPTKAAAEIEASKAFAKNLMREAGIPTAQFRTFTNYDEAASYMMQVELPVVIKASGLALGKGVVVAKTHEEAESALEAFMLDATFGDAGKTVVIEEYLEGPEISVHALANGTDFALFPPSQDHKQIGDGGTGPNTGGMGVVAPLPWVTSAQMDEIATKVVRPVLEALKAQNRPFSGLLYPGLKMTKGGPKVLEFNARFGDPETETYMRLLKSDLLDLLALRADLQNIEWHPGAAANVILASGGYPGSYEKGKVITGIKEANRVEGVRVFHCGTAIKDGHLVTNGGRVLSVSAVGADLREALDRVYTATSKIHFDGMHYRRDIGAKSLGI